MSESLSLLFKKDRTWANRSCHSLQRSNVSDLIMIRSFPLKTPAIRSKKSCFSTSFLPFFTVFPLFLCPSANPSRRESLFHSFAHKKTRDSLEKPKSKLPTLRNCRNISGKGILFYSVISGFLIREFGKIWKLLRISKDFRKLSDWVLSRV